MSPPIRDGSGNSIGSIRLGDGSEISEVRTGAEDVLFSATTIPDSGLDHFYWAASINSISTWPDSEGSEDASETASTASISDINGTDAVDYPSDTTHQTSNAWSTGASEEYTFLLVFDLDNNNNNNRPIVNGGGGSNGVVFDVQYGTDNHYRLVHEGVVGVNFGTSDTDPHIAVGTYDGSNIIVDIDGSEALNTAISAPSTPSGTAEIGGDTVIGTSIFTDGRIGAAGWEAAAADVARRDELTNLMADEFGISVST